jgi:hypothetical protein
MSAVQHVEDGNSIALGDDVVHIETQVWKRRSHHHHATLAKGRHVRTYQQDTNVANAACERRQITSPPRPRQRSRSGLIGGADVGLNRGG